MIASIEDDRRNQMRDPATLVAELHEIAIARGRLDRHANDSRPPRPDYTLDSLRVPILEEQASARPSTLVGSIIEWVRTRLHDPNA
jgi:hypothetical protein